MLEATLTALITSITLLMGGYFILKRYVENIKNELLDELFDLPNTEQGAKVLYTVGALIGNGAKQGFGLNVKGGKFKFEDIIAQAAGGFLQNIIGGAVPQQTGETPPPTPQPQAITNFKSKY